MTELGHVVYYVRDLQDSLKFYTGVVGLSVSGTIFNGRAALLSGGRTHHELLLIEVGDADGPLAGKRIGLKDNIAVAGFPMTCGSTVLQGFISDTDATIVTRLPAAGAEIVAILNMDNFAFSGAVAKTIHFAPLRSIASNVRSTAPVGTESAGRRTAGTSFHDGSSVASPSSPRAARWAPA